MKVLRVSPNACSEPRATSKGEAGWSETDACSKLAHPAASYLRPGNRRRRGKALRRGQLPVFANFALE